ncbi:hypothetical protein EG68_02409 [Paragonimus skrjabini miyazakii]|uniref:Uncharacterized protein n=1 Tax=Paragonimus skrjabini miyazakii TaxID=59628 RepID=A0A8S9Z8A6_9TREM|nr:hypothetical protein EG68_02409 [Paragonimus skrjabini miyazakii]
MLIATGCNSIYTGALMCCNCSLTTSCPQTIWCSSRREQTDTDQYVADDKPL